MVCCGRLMYIFTIFLPAVFTVVIFIVILKILFCYEWIFHVSDLFGFLFVLIRFSFISLVGVVTLFLFTFFCGLLVSTGTNNVSCASVDGGAFCYVFRLFCTCGLCFESVPDFGLSFAIDKCFVVCLTAVGLSSFISSPGALVVFFIVFYCRVVCSFSFVFVLVLVL